MNSNYKPANAIPWANQGTLTEIIDEQIAWYEQNATRKDDDYIVAHLELIKKLAENVESSNDIMFLEKIFKTFGEILETQRGVIDSLQADLDSAADIASAESAPITYLPPEGGYVSEKQVEATFTAYMQREGKSSYTANDYCSRIRNVWHSFYKACKDAALPEELTEDVLEEQILPDSPLLNAYRHLDELSCYISIMLSETQNNRNWQNARASLNKFSDALLNKGEKGNKAIPSKQGEKDFSKYLFEGKAYKKARLVLAVVQRYIKDKDPRTFAELEEAFPASLQGSLGVVRLENKVSDKYKGHGGVKRYFISEDEIIRLNPEETAIVCTQWGIENTERLIAYVEKAFGYQIEKV